MLFAQLELDFEPSLPSHGNDLVWLQIQISKSLSAFDPHKADFRTEVQVSRKLALSHGDLEGPATRDSGDFVLLGGSYLATRCFFFGHEPACHGNLQGRHQMRTLIEVALQRDRVIPRVEGARQRLHVRNTDPP